ncbi:hypothetical protein GCM10025872_08590 [Barrientosiimonas endolithica]|uniref:Uncharacterized protein n=1 Tax=Barrientosiimonas endolithica TaxID=1535208 RepID=A0ABN6YI98_9MICO|nr:hypothetical protein GCM10025872_08590 [Barrientosiimonas endolithica]
MGRWAFWIGSISTPDEAPSRRLAWPRIACTTPSASRWASRGVEPVTLTEMVGVSRTCSALTRAASWSGSRSSPSARTVSRAVSTLVASGTQERALAMATADGGPSDERPPPAEPSCGTTYATAVAV